MADVVPYILSIFSNPPKGQPGHLAYLELEQEKIQDLVTTTKTRTRLDYMSIADSAGLTVRAGDISNPISLFAKQLSVIHYSGHADEGLLSLNDGDLRAERFIKYINECDNIKLVVLNGCSTQGFVKALLEKTKVKAVIATSRPVRDNQAADFSKEFYEKLLKGRPVADAFTWALSVVLEDYRFDNNIYKASWQGDTIRAFDLLNDDPDANGTRAVKAPAKLLFDKANEPAPWGIFAKRNELLDWSIFEMTDSEKRIGAIDAEIAKQKKLTIDGKMKVQDLEYVIGLIDGKSVKTQQDILVRAVKEQERQEVQRGIDAANDAITQLENEKASIADDKNIDDLIRSLTTSVHRLNYDGQNSRINIIQLEREEMPKQFFCFILHGDTKSCLHLLSHRMRGWLGFEDEKKAIFDFDASSMDEFWLKLQKDMDVKEYDPDPDKAIKKILPFYRDPSTKKTINDLLLIFRNKKKDGASADIFNKQVFGHWKDFITRFKAADNGQGYDHGIYAFIIDDTCEIKLEGQCYTSSRALEYTNTYSADLDVRPTFHLLPVVNPLEPETLFKWQVDCNLQSSYRYKLAELKQIVKENNGLFLDTVTAFGTGKLTNAIMAARVAQAIRQGIDIPIPI